MEPCDDMGGAAGSPDPRISHEDLLEAYLRTTRTLLAARLDAHGVVLVANGRLGEFAGRDLHGRPLTEVIAASQQERFRDALGAAGAEWSWAQVGLTATPVSVPVDMAIAVARAPDGFLVLAEPVKVDVGDVATRLIELTNDVISEQRRQDLEDRWLGPESAADPVTGLVNRRVLDVQLEARLRASFRFARPLTIAMIEVDHRAAVYEAAGHAAWHAILVGVARTVQGVVRDGDLVGRYGSAVFLVVLDDCGVDEATAWAECARQAICDRQVTPPDRRVMVSFGVAELREERTVARLIERADAALVVAKRLGWNRVVLA
jgi:diguanylate cyclase (GGDEF)-like protein